MDEVLTAQEVAVYLRVSRATVWRWCASGRLKAFKAGRSWRIYRSSVEDFIAQGGPHKNPTRKEEEP